MAPAASAAPTTAPPAVGTSRLQLVSTAEAALARGDTNGAQMLLERVLNTPPGQDESSDEAEAIDAFSHLRLMLLLGNRGLDTEANQQLAALQARAPGLPLTRLAEQIWHEYGMTGDFRAACMHAVVPATTAFESVLSAGIRVDPTTFCQLPPGG
jgi:hypothetical protein